MDEYTVVVSDREDTCVCRSFETMWEAQRYANHVDEITGGAFWVSIVKRSGC
jgi:hypothetical protein